MEKPRIEAWALDVIERVVHGQPNEDSLVELKTGWPEAKVARQLAAHANAARGQPILWLFGVDEEARSVPGVEARKFQEWWRSVQSRFDGTPPYPMEHVVRYGDPDAVSVFAVCFASDAPPYVVKTASSGQAGERAQLEVPWREGTEARSAKRAELLRMLLPTRRAPSIGDLAVEGSLEAAYLGLWIVGYLVPPPDTIAWVPYDMCGIRCRLGDGEPFVPKINVIGASRGFLGMGSPPTIVNQGGQLEVAGPGWIEFQTQMPFTDAAHRALVESSLPSCNLDVEIELGWVVDGEKTTIPVRLTAHPLGKQPGRGVGGPRYEWVQRSQTSAFEK